MAGDDFPTEHEVVELRRRTPEERLDWLTWQVALLRAEVNQLKRDEGHRDDLAPSAPTSAYDESAPRTPWDPGPLYELCTDPDCPVAWAYRSPPADHYHYRGPPSG